MQDRGLHMVGGQSPGEQADNFIHAADVQGTGDEQAAHGGHACAFDPGWAALLRGYTGRCRSGSRRRRQYVLPRGAGIRPD